MLHRERQRDVAAHRETGDVGRAAVEDPRRVVGEVGDAVRLGRHLRAPGAACVEDDDVETLAKTGTW
jgi:hypothetical protein